MNYKDTLSISGHKGITRNFPHIPGIDAAGVVVQSPNFKQGEEVLVTGYDLGMNTFGGFSEYVCVPSDWVVPKPKTMSLHDTMVYGTAGFTAAMSVYALEKMGVNPKQGPAVVTGSTGGVGVLSIAILSKLGFEVVAVSGKKESHDWLKSLGATKVIQREDLDDQSKRPLLKGIYAAGYRHCWR